MRPLLLAAILLTTSASAQTSQTTLSPLRTQAPVISTGAGGTTSAAGGGCPGQAFLAIDWLGNLFRVDDPFGLPNTVLLSATGVNLLFDFAVDPTTGFYYGLKDIGTGTDLVRFDPVTFASVNLGSLPFPQLNAMDFSFNGNCFVRSSIGGDLFKIDVANLSGTLLASPAGPGTAGDLAVDLDGSIVSLLANGNVDRYDPASGVLTQLGNHGLGGDAFGFDIGCDGRAIVTMNDGRLYELDLVSMNTTFLGNMSLPLNSLIFGASFVQPADIGSLGTNYCTATTNSTGVSASIRAFGSFTAADNSLLLRASDLPAGQFAYFLAAQSQDFFPLVGGSQGNLCVGSPTARFNSQVGPTTGGEFAINVDIGNIPLPPTFAYVIQAGETWNFQCWFRDANPSSTSNFTDGIQILFL